MRARDKKIELGKKGTSTKNEELRREDKIKEGQEGDATREKGLEKKAAGGKVQGMSARHERYK